MTAARLSFAANICYTKNPKRRTEQRAAEQRRPGLGMRGSHRPGTKVRHLRNHSRIPPEPRPSLTRTLSPPSLSLFLSSSFSPPPSSSPSFRCQSAAEILTRLKHERTSGLMRNYFQNKSSLVSAVMRVLRERRKETGITLFLRPSGKQWGVKCKTVAR